MTWSIDPIAFSLGFLNVRYYGIFFFLAVMISVFGFNYLMEKYKRVNVNLDNFFFGLIVLALIGGRSFYFLLSDLSGFVSNPLVFFNIDQGGNSSIGTLLFTSVFFILYAKKSHNHPVDLADHLSIFAAASAAMIRLGNFFNSEIVGVKTNLPWSVVFSRVDNTPRHPVQLYEFILLVGICLGLFFFVRAKGWPKVKGLISGLCLSSYFGVRFFLEFLKEYTNSQLLGPFGTTQWACLGLSIFGILSIGIAFRNKPISEG